MKQETILHNRAKLAAAFPSTTEILRGSLLHRRIRHRDRDTAGAELGELPQGRMVHSTAHYQSAYALPSGSLSMDLV